MELTVVIPNEGKQWHYTTPEKQIYVGSSSLPTSIPVSGRKRFFSWQNPGKWFTRHKQPNIKTIYNQLIIEHVASHHLLLEEDGWNLKVTNLVSANETTLAEVGIPQLEQRLWLPQQELRLNDYVVIFQSSTPEDLRRKWNLGKTVGAIFRWLLLLLFLFSVMALSWYLVFRIMANNPAGTSIAPQSTGMPEAMPNPTSTINMNKPTATTIPTLPVFAKEDGAQAISQVQASTETTSTEQTADASTPTPKWVISSALPIWEPANIAEAPPVGLGLNFIPAQGTVGQQYFRLAHVIWLDEAQSGGRHNIYVDVRNINSGAAVRPEVSISWKDGACTNTIPSQADTSAAQTTNDIPFDRYPVQCAMGSAGYAYSVNIVGYPSDRLERLGMGTPNNREIPILTSFVLIFERDTFQ